MVRLALHRLPELVRSRAVRRWLAVAALGVALVSCRSPRAANPSQTGAIPIDTVAPEYRADYEAVLDAQRADPAGDGVVEAADRLLDREPPLDLRLAALLAKGQHAHANGDDRAALDLVDQALTEASGGPLPDELRAALERLRAFSLARGGDPELALEALKGLDASGRIETVELRGAQAVAFERKGDPGAATLAYLAWRELLGAEDPAAGYAERKFRALSSSLDEDALRFLAEQAKGDAAATCLRIRAGDPIPEGKPAWIASCAPGPRRIGVLLPRTGRLAALADLHLGALMAGAEVLEREGEVALSFVDAGSTPDAARAAARKLAAEGVDAVVGPVGVPNVEAARAALFGAPLFVPGEPVAGAVGASASLEARAEALVTAARNSGRREVLILIPANAYGRRIADRARASAEGMGLKVLKLIEYPADTTSFKPLLQPVLGKLGTGSAVIIGDAMPRVDLVVRQLQRLGVAVDRPDAPGVLVATTGEGLDHRALGSGLEGVLIAPAAALDPRTADFARVYERREGVPPGDQALLVWRALDAAVHDDRTARRPDLVRVQGGAVVRLEAAGG